MPVYATGRTQGITKGVSLNTTNAAISEYINYGFNSFAKLDGKYLGANENGLYLLEGDDDNGTAITGTFRLALRDFKTSLFKRLIMCYLGIKYIGQMNIKTVDQSETLSAARPMISLSDNFQTLRVKFGRGSKKRYWAVDIANDDGEDFTIDTLELKAIPTERRIG